jgi:hypothetical protein
MDVFYTKRKIWGKVKMQKFGAAKPLIPFAFCLSIFAF